MSGSRGDGGRKFSRRSMLAGIGVGAAVFSIVPRHVLGASGLKAPSDKLNIAGIGAGGQGGNDIGQMGGENVVALCDVDDRQGGGSYKKYPGAKRFKDFRKMFDAMDRNIDAVTIGTPDHTHFVIAMEAIRRGKHVYCEKPLAHSIAEVRALVKAAKEKRVVTQLGNQGHSDDRTRALVEWVRDGAIGQVKEIHAGCDAFRDVYTQIGNISKLSERPEVPKELDWDLWLGPAANRPYQPFYLPFNWRGWSAFGSGCLGDWVCHVVDPSYWALALDAPSTVLAEVDGYDPKTDFESFPKGTKITFEFPAKGSRGPVTLYWYDGDRKIPRPEALEKDRKVPGIGAVLIGEKGGISHGSHGAKGCRVFPETAMREYKRPTPYLPRTKGHHEEWLDAIRQNRPADSDFSYGGPLTEIALVGVIAIRFAGQKLQWNSARMQFTNCPEANQLVTPSFRTGWKL